MNLFSFFELNKMVVELSLCSSTTSRDSLNPVPIPSNQQNWIKLLWTQQIQTFKFNGIISDSEKDFLPHF